MKKVDLAAATMELPQSLLTGVPWRPGNTIKSYFNLDILFAVLFMVTAVDGGGCVKCLFHSKGLELAEALLLLQVSPARRVELKSL